MNEQHPNVALIERLDPEDMTASPEAFAEDVVWRFFNPHLPDIQGEYVGLSGIRLLFEKLGAALYGGVRIKPISLTPMGDELVVAHTQNSLNLGGQTLTIDVVVVWRIVQGRIAEVWDIPSAHTTRTAPG